MLVVRGNLAHTMMRLGDLEGALRIQREVHATAIDIYGEDDDEVIKAAGNMFVVSHLLNIAIAVLDFESLATMASPCTPSCDVNVDPLSQTMIRLVGLHVFSMFSVVHTKAYTLFRGPIKCEPRAFTSLARGAYQLPESAAPSSPPLPLLTCACAATQTSN
jgi:hypothetical protein